MSTESYAEMQRRFGERLRAIRSAHGYSQEALALASGLDRSYIGGVERGERNISLVNICKLAETLKLTPKDFFE
jgi:transcriptional regulator with XRE-family HTH domain